MNSHDEDIQDIQISVSAHIPRTKTQVKKIVSDIPPHTNQNIGIG